MKRPSNQYLYGFSGSFGAGVNVTKEEEAALDRELKDESQAARQLDAAIEGFRARTRKPFPKPPASGVVDVALVPAPDAAGGPIVDVALVPKPDGAL